MTNKKVAAAISGFDRIQIASALMLLKHRTGQLGLFKTMHAMDTVTQVIGYELAEHIEATEHLAAKDAAYRKRRHAGKR